MKTVEITHPAGVGDWSHGAIVELDDARARRLILIGYGREVIPTAALELDEPQEKGRRVRRESPR